MERKENKALIKSDTKPEKQNNKLTKDEKEELENLCHQIHIAKCDANSIPYYEPPIGALADEVLKENFKTKDLKTESRRIYFLCLKQMEQHKGKNNTLISVLCVAAALGIVVYGLTSATGSMQTPCIIFAAVLALIGVWGTFDTSPRFTKVYIKDLHDSAYRLMHLQQKR